MKGSCHFSLLLNAHQPFVARHGGRPDAEARLYESTRDGYLPLISAIRRIAAHTGTVCINMSISPTLAEMLSDNHFRTGFGEFMDRTVKSVTEDLRFFAEAGRKEMIQVAEYWLRKYDDLTILFSDIGGDIISELSRLESNGLELMTSAATSTHIPLLGSENCIRAQVKIGARVFAEHFGHEPDGIWLPEATPGRANRWKNQVTGTELPREGIEEAVASAGLKYFVASAFPQHGVRQQDHRSTGHTLTERSGDDAATLSPEDAFRSHVTVCRNGIVAIFAGNPVYAMRDSEDNELHSPDTGYLDCNRRGFPGGNRYWCKTGAGALRGRSQPYLPELAAAKTEKYATEFLDSICGPDFSPERTVAATAIDAELFGSLWHEGPCWILQIYEKMNRFGISGRTLGSLIDESAFKENSLRVEGSIEDYLKIRSQFNRSTSGIWKPVYEYEEEYTGFLHTLRSDAPGLKERVLKQMGRELLLLESSCWSPHVSGSIEQEHLQERVALHSGYFGKLREIATKNEISEEELRFLEQCEKTDRIFQKLDLSSWD